MSLDKQNTSKLLTVEEQLDKRKKACQNFLDKCKRKEDGIIDVAPTDEERRQKTLEKKRLYNKAFRETHRVEYNLYMNNKMKERYQNNEEFRLKELERGKMRSLKYRQNKALLLDKVIADNNS